MLVASLYSGGVLFRDEVDLFLDVFLGPAAAREDSVAILNHFRMAAEIAEGCLWG